MWQDYILSSSNVMFAIMLLPQLKRTIKNNESMSIVTCGLTFVGLCIVNITMVTLELWLAALPICTIIWGLLFYYSWRNR